jgi:hypothetical protein
MAERIAMRRPHLPVSRHVAAAASHNEAAGRAQLPVFRFHAGGDFRHVRDGIGAQPHRVTRAGLLSIRAALRVGAGEAEKNRPGQQCQTAYDTHDPHFVVPVFEKPLFEKSIFEMPLGAQRK